MSPTDQTSITRRFGLVALLISESGDSRQTLSRRRLQVKHPGCQLIRKVFSPVRVLLCFLFVTCRPAMPTKRICRSALWGSVADRHRCTWLMSDTWRPGVRGSFRLSIFILWSAGHSHTVSDTRKTLGPVGPDVSAPVVNYFRS
jgi:hypothetical protein